MESRLYSWVDVQDLIFSYSDQFDIKFFENINFRVYWDGVLVSYTNIIKIDEIINIFDKMFLSRFERNENGEIFIVLDTGNKLPVNLEEVDVDDINTMPFKLSISRPTFIGSSKKYDPVGRMAVDRPAIYAFHSFKGGVGRTLHAISLAVSLSQNSKVLLIDADFEAPGISWLANAPISFSDFLTLLHSDSSVDTVLRTVAENIKGGEKEKGNLLIFPAFRSLVDTTPTLEIKPEHIYKFNENPFILTDVLIQLSKMLGVDYVIIDLRAGVSELASSWFFDPRVNKIFVTTLSSQSILGTSMMFRMLSKFENLNLEGPSTIPGPSIIISQVPKSALSELEANWGDVYIPTGLLSPLRNSYVEAFIDLSQYNEQDGFKDLTDEQIIGRILAPITLFSEEYDSLKSLPNNWDEVVKLIRINKLDSKIVKLVELFPTANNKIARNFVDLRVLLKRETEKLIFAETKQQNDFLQTESIRNLISSFQILLPVAVIVGAKGSGKTFLFSQIANLKNWRDFGKKVYSGFENFAIILPITLPANLSNVNSLKDVPEDLKNVTVPQVSESIWQEYIKPDIERTLKNDVTATGWREKWFDYIAWASGYQVGTQNVGREFINLLKEKRIRVVAVFDGLEDLFKRFNTDTHQKTAIESLLQDVPTWLESQTDRCLGVIVFVRKDIVTSSILQNSSQFLKKYENFELKWNVEEALRLVHWVLNKYVIQDNPTFENWETSLNDKTENELVSGLHILWGMRMAKNSSKEAYSNNWILGSLANLKKEIQSRDIIRFLATSAEKTTETVDPKIVNLYTDRILFPTAIRDSIDEVGRSKIEEVKIENEPLKEVLESLEKTENIKFPCKPEEFRNIFEDGEKIKILEDNGVVVLYNGEYYMAELYRKGMGFEYSRKGRPKVLYF